MKECIIGLLIATMLVLAGCGNVYTADAVKTCKTGKYNLNNEMKQIAELSGLEVEYVSLIENNGYCSVGLKLKKPMVIMGTQLNVYPIMTCDIECVNTVLDDKNKYINWAQESHWRGKNFTLEERQEQLSNICCE